ncbi:hypothetical protein PR048_000087 [Dryococelus australis]|uniref:Major facilitator superfamily (MFS) profile domain-containing protein n=1 Tax=Dryococelus australis TaxID=614101 RepID=A0ABQ9IDP1_9NEOP|nr:hypothetical protein PR048_000087 [Dryococelus australis]
MCTQEGQGRGDVTPSLVAFEVALKTDEMRDGLLAPGVPVWDRLNGVPRQHDLTYMTTNALTLNEPLWCLFVPSATWRFLCPEIETAVETTRALELTWRESFATTAAKKALLVSLGLMIFQQLSGINAVVFYLADIFKHREGISRAELCGRCRRCTAEVVMFVSTEKESAGLSCVVAAGGLMEAGSELAPSTASIIIGVIQVIASFISTLVVDRAGRRIMLMASHSVMGICSIILGIYFHIKEDVPNIGWLPLASLCVYIVLFSFGVGPIPWLMVGELFPAQIKGAASSIACLVNWLLSFIVTKFFSDLLTSIGPDYTFWMFGVILCVGTLFVFFIVPETKGKTLEEIQSDLGGAGNKGGPEEIKLPQYGKERLNGTAAMFDAQFTSQHQRLSDTFENTLIVPNNPCSGKDAGGEFLFGFRRGFVHQDEHVTP